MNEAVQPTLIPVRSQHFEKSPVMRTKSPPKLCMPLDDLTLVRTFEPSTDEDDGKSSNPTSHRDESPLSARSMEAESPLNRNISHLDAKVLSFLDLKETQSQPGDSQGLSPNPSSHPIETPGRLGYFHCPPPILISQDFLKKIHSLPMSVMWANSSQDNSNTYWSVRFHQLKGVITLTIEFKNTFPSCIKLQERALFKDISTEAQRAWRYHYQDPAQHQTDNTIESTPDISSTLLAKPLVIKRQDLNPQKISVKKLIPYLEAKRVLFYTGSGISAEVVKATAQFMRELGLNYGIRGQQEAYAFIKNILSMPHTYISPPKRLFHVCMNEFPSDAHSALAKLLFLKNWGLVTENIDLLHQCSGIDPLNLRLTNLLNDKVAEADLKEIDIIVTIGLEHDTNGFLGWYKELNPTGKIVAISDKVTSYLDQESYFLQGDPQVLVPQLYEALL